MERNLINADNMDVPQKHPWRLDVLLKDYELSEGRLKESEGRIIQITGLALPVMGASTTTSYLLFQQPQSLDVQRLVAWLAPLLFILVYALIIYVVYFKVSHYYHCRMVAELINFELGRELLFRFRHKNPYNFASLRYGSRYFLLIYIQFLLISLCLFGVTFFQSFSFVASKDPSYALYYAFSYLIAFSLEIIACYGVLIVLPKDYAAEYDKLVLEGQTLTKSASEKNPPVQ